MSINEVVLCIISIKKLIFTKYEGNRRYTLKPVHNNVCIIICKIYKIMLYVLFFILMEIKGIIEINIVLIHFIKILN